MTTPLVRWDECSRCFVCEKYNAYSDTGEPGTWKKRINWKFEYNEKGELVKKDELVGPAEELAKDRKEAIERKDIPKADMSEADWDEFFGTASADEDWDEAYTGYGPSEIDIADKALGLKYDDGKPRVDLVDPYFYLEMGRVLGYGASKYADENWRRGIPVKKLIGSMERHIAEFKRGQAIDVESLFENLAHVAINCMMASWMVVNRPELDDRIVDDVRIDD